MNATQRECVKAIDDILYEQINVLNSGFVRVIDYMGSDSAIVQAARVSYGKGTKQINQDRNLIFYLMKNKHTSPFEMCEIKLHLKMPIFIARQWIRHRTANVNEYSARYSILDNDFYVPDIEQIATQSDTNKQGRGSAIDSKWAQEIIDIFKKDNDEVYNTYEMMLNSQDSNNFNPMKPNLSREIARINLPLSCYTQMYWKIDLHNLLHFIELRISDHAQFEIREYARVLLDIVKKWCPIVYDAFVEYRLESKNFSKTALQIIKKKLKGEDTSHETSQINKREWNEICKILDI